MIPAPVSPVVVGWLAAGLLAITPQARAAQLPESPSAVRYLALPKQSLAAQLSALTQQFQIAFVVRTELLAGKQAPALTGNFQLQQALALLLKGSGLAAHVSLDGLVLVPAEQVSDSQQTSLEEVTVTGLRHSLTKSKQIKQQAEQISDVIAAQDLAQYPDLNLAESLQRVPGVAITREAGEGRQVSLRGAYPDFSLVTLNGMPVLANNDSPMDSRIQKQRDRSFDFNVFTSELFNQIQVFKTYSAEQTAGGLTGTIALGSAKPFQDPGLHLMLSPAVGQNQYRDTLASRISGLVSNTWQHWGALLAFSYSDREVQEQGANTFRWRNILPTGADISALDEDIQQAWQAGELVVPKGNRYSVWRNQQQRMGLGLSLQYQSQILSMDLDAIVARLSGERDENHLYPRGSQSTPVIQGLTRVTEAEINADNELVYARYADARVGTESRHQQVQTDYQQLVWQGHLQITEWWQLNWLLGQQDASYAIPLSAKVYMRGISDVSLDYREDPFYVDARYSADLTQADFWQMHEIELESFATDTDQELGKLSLALQASNQIHYQFGLEWHRMTSSAHQVEQSDILKSDWESLPSGDPALQIPAQYSYVLNAHPQLDWLALQPMAVARQYGLDPRYLANNAVETVTSTDAITESTWASFVQGQWQGDDWQVNAGMRYQQDNTQVQNNQSQLTSRQQLRYYSLLPALNLIYFASPQSQVRIGLSRNIARPLLSDMLKAIAYDADTATLTGFNANLHPYQGNNLDLAWEYYGDDTFFVSLAWFYKQIDDYIVSLAQQMTFADTGLASVWQGEPLADDQWLTLVTKQNAEEAWLQGVEMSLQWDWTFLPAPFDHLGLAAQGAINAGKVSYYDEDYGQKLFRKNFPYMSKYTGAMTLFYETDRFSARLSATYRDRYIARVDSNTLIDEDETGFHPSTYFDASLSWQFRPGLELRLDANNLSNEREEQYSDSSDRAYNSTTFGRSFYLGMSFHL